MIQTKIPLRQLKDHETCILAVTVFPDRRRMVTGSNDKTLRLWDLNTGTVLKKMAGHHNVVSRLAVSLGDGQLIASGDIKGRLIAWHGETGEQLTPQIIKAHSNWITSLDFSPDGTVLATGSADHTTKLWDTTTWQMQGDAIQCSSGGSIRCCTCVRYSPSGKLLAIATHKDIKILNSGTRECVAEFKGHAQRNYSLAWTPDGTRLLTGGDENDPTIREWDASTWQQVGDPWMGHSRPESINFIAVHPASNLVASAAHNRLLLWRLSDRHTIAIFHHSACVRCFTFSVDGKHILSGGDDKMISEWEVPKKVLSQETLTEPASKAQAPNLKILSIDAIARNACIAGKLSTAEELFTREIDIDCNSYIYESYANRSLVVARKHDWDHALEDAIKSISIQPSLTGYISKGIALCGKGKVLEAKIAFDLAFMFTNEDSNITHFLLLIKAVAIFNANQHEEAIIRVQSLTAACPHNDILACRVVEAYLHVRLGVNATNDARHSEAADFFTQAISLLNSNPSSSTADIAYLYEDLVVLFGWDLKSLWQDAHQNRCDAFRRAGRTEEALDSYRSMMDVIDENAKARCLDWSNAFMQEYSELHLASGNAALAACDYDRAIALYSVAINLNSTKDIIFANRGKAKLEKMLWEDALFDAEKVIELNPSSHVGYEVKHTALRGARRYDEAIPVFEIMLSKLNTVPEALIRELPQHYFKAEDAIRGAIQRMELENVPLRLLNTSTGLLCDRGAQINAFQTSRAYNELLLSSMMHTDLPMESITDTVTTYLHCAMLSHRWGEQEPLLHDIKDKAVYELKEAGHFMKLQSFCKIARRAGYHWAWVDTCCIDQNNLVELQKSLNSMFTWYHHSALTVVYLSDVPPSSKSGAMAKSAWNTRGWTVPEFLAPQVIRFYQQDWTPYLNDVSSNHKESAEIMHELEVATGIDARTLVTFQPGMRDAREKLQWASKRVTTLPEDIAYSLFGIFGIQLPILYGENKQRALGRLLQEIVAQSGDITALDWVGKPSKFNSCLPAKISSYAAPPCTLPCLSEEEIQTAVSSLRHTVDMDDASKFYDKLANSYPRFSNCRLRLPCIIFPVTEVRRRPGAAHEILFTYGVKADGLCDLLITTEQTLVQFSRARSTPPQTFLLALPWDRRLLELTHFADDAESLGGWSGPESLDGSPGEEELADSESYSRALRLIVRLGQPFTAFLLAQPRSGEYKRIASDHSIIAQIKNVASIHNMMDVRTLEIL
ncbi:hypothetical protein CY34DRAFT_812772 [Suillus luteus UH-Slu-Lm8-n1]|uniref:Heterokaryon incompatibility domain-containing protein n=1 Tax=Suillus luteus UH-Slu-Lm8-n1 TaxID=930992 RepID=A0A0D0A961_9AGAM|nr:hypothetical protein CY34DRAFT_812772 [Suillus luteus UH-Slu-Lm8-n1]